MLAIIDIISIKNFDNEIFNNRLRASIREDILRSIYRFDTTIVAIIVIIIVTISLASLIFQFL